MAQPAADGQNCIDVASIRCDVTRGAIRSFLKEADVRKLIVVRSMWCILTLLTPVYAQQVDVAFGGGSMAAPTTANSFSGATASLSGGAYVGFGGDVLIKKNLGAEAEIFWRGSQASYGGQIPYRPLFWAFNGIYAPRFNEHFGAEVLAGIGAESVRFYQGAYNCDIYGNCSNYVSSTHFMGDVGGGLKFYVYRSFFVRPEMRLYLIHNNVEFVSSRAFRYGASIGYTFGGSK
jgi:hypothetical protein